MNEPSKTNRPKQTRKEWTSNEIATVRENAHLGADTLALILNRSVSSVEQLAYRLRISLRQEGSRRGSILGQPRGTRWTNQEGANPVRLAAIRSDILDGTSDPAELEARAREIALGSSKPSCPSCGVRPQTRSTTGLCEVCHLRALAQAHRDDQATREAKRELWRARQEASRSRRAKANGDR